MTLKNFYRNCTLMAFEHKWLLLSYFVIFLLSFSYEVSPFTSPDDRYIGGADQAELALLAKNLYLGNGPVVDTTWVLHAGGIPGRETTKGIGYWSVYQGFIYYLFFLVFGPGRVTILIADSIAKLLIAALVSLIVYRLTLDPITTFTAAVYMTTHPSMAARVSGYTDMTLTFLMLLSWLIMIRSFQTGAKKLLLLAGVLTGLSIGLKTTGWIVVVSFFCALPLIRTKIDLRAIIPIYIAGVMIALTPLAVYNYQYFGRFFPLDYSYIHSASMKGNIVSNGLAPHGEVWCREIYNPESTWFDSRSLSSIDYLKLYLQRARNSFQYVYEGSFFPLFFYPFLFAFIFEKCRILRQKFTWSRLDATNLENIFSVFALLVIVSGICLSLFAHYEERYFNYIIPFLLTVSIVQCRRYSKTLVLFVLIYTILQGVNCHVRHTGIVTRRMPVELHTAMKIVPKKSVVMTFDPWSIAYHTDTRCVMAPYTEKDQVILSVAERYRVEYLVMLIDTVRHQHYLTFRKKPPSFLSKVYEDEKLLILKFNLHNTTFQPDSENQSSAYP